MAGPGIMQVYSHLSSLCSPFRNGIRICWTALRGFLASLFQAIIGVSKLLAMLFLKDSIESGFIHLLVIRNCVKQIGNDVVRGHQLRHQRTLEDRGRGPLERAKQSLSAPLGQGFSLSIGE